MSYWLWRILLICIVLGTVQWGYTHPNSKLTVAAKKYWDEAQAEVAKHF